MASFTKQTARIAGFLLIAYLCAWVKQIESFTKPEFMLPLEFLNHQLQTQDKESASGNEAGSYLPLQLPRPRQHQPVVMDPAPAPPIPSSPLLPLGFPQPIATPSHPLFPPIGQVLSLSGRTSPKIDSGMRLDLSGTLLIISDRDANDRCPYQGFHPLGPKYQSAYLVCIPGENNMFIGMEVNCPKEHLFSTVQTRCVGKDDLEMEQRMIRTLEIVREMRERELVPYPSGYAFGRANKAEVEASEQLDGTQMEEFVEPIFVGMDQETALKQLFIEEDQERLLELAELLEEVEREEAEQGAFLEVIEVVGAEDRGEELDNSVELEETDEVVETVEAEVPIVEAEDVKVLHAEVEQVEHPNFDVISELLRAEDWVMVDNFRGTEENFEDPVLMVRENYDKFSLGEKNAAIEVNNLDNMQ